MADILATVGGTRRTPQTRPARADQVPNNAGGYVFALDDEARLRRFLILGVDGGTYYANATDHALDNVGVVDRMIGDETAGLLAVRIAVDISQAGRARKNQPALFVIAAASASPHLAVRRAAFDALPKVARTGTHLFEYTNYVIKHRGWGKGLQKAIGRWYLDMDVQRLALQLVKYRARAGWTHRDEMRVSHGHLHLPAEYATKMTEDRHAALLFAAAGVQRRQALADAAVLSAAEIDGRLNAYDALETAAARIVGDGPTPESLATLAETSAIEIFTEDSLRVIRGYLEAAGHGEKLTPRRAVELVRDYRLPWEALPSQVLGSAEVWAALLPRMGLTAMIRQLPTMTRAGLLDQRGDATRQVIARLADADQLKRARVHPLSLLVAARTYAAGHSARGSNTWTPVQRIVDALDEAFYLSFGAVQPTGKRLYLALDVSGSMSWNTICDAPGITPRVASAALALVTANVESDYEIRGFSDRMVDVPISPRMRLDQALAVVDGIYMGRTDCSLPMLDAAARRADVDQFVVYTDSETWAGDIHPFQALRDYRQRSGIPARLAVVGMTSTGFTIADPSDPGMLDVAGFDTATPELVSAFARGEF